VLSFSGPLTINVLDKLLIAESEFKIGFEQANKQRIKSDNNSFFIGLIIGLSLQVKPIERKKKTEICEK
jgi:hypothetical protein